MIQNVGIMFLSPLLLILVQEVVAVQQGKKR